MANRVFFASDKSLALAVDHTVYRYGTTLEYVDASHIKVKGNQYIRIDQALVVIDTDTTIGWECLDTGSPEASKTYHVYVCIQSGNNEPIFRISLSDSAPSGFDTTTSREIGTFQTDSSGDIDPNSITGPSGGWIPKVHGNEAHDPNMLPLSTSNPINAYMSGDKWLSVATSGIVGLPKQSACFVRLSADQLLAHNAFTTIEFDVVNFDTQGEFDTTTHRFTASEGGMYVVGVAGRMTYGNHGKLALYVKKNGVRLAAVARLEHMTNIGNWVGNGSALLQLDAGDYIEYNAHWYNYVDGTDQYLSAYYNETYGWVIKVA